MKKTLSVVALVAVAGCAVSAYAAPRESVTFTAVDSNGRINDAANQSRTATFAGSDGGGAYVARFLTVSGSHREINTATIQSEAAILITPPSGQPFICRPIITGVTGTATIPAGAFVIPVSTFTTAGEWTFRFFELFDDGATTSVDGVWDTITFTLDDAAPVTGANPGPNQNITLTNLDVDGSDVAPTTTSFTVSGANQTGVVRISAVGTGRTADPALNSNVNPLSRARFQLVAPDGVTTSPIFQPWATGTQSSSTAEATGGLTAPVPVAGTWTLRMWDTGNFDGIDNTIQTMTVSFLDPPTAPTSTTLPALVDNTFVSSVNQPINAGEVKWFSFVVPTSISAAEFRGLDIDNEGSTVTDTGMALYNANGTFIVLDTVDGTDLLAAMSFGRGTRPAPGNGVAYNGRDGALSAGTHYLAVTSGTVTNNTTLPWGAQTTSTLAGTINVNVRYVANTGGQPPTDAVQMTLTEGVWNTATKALPAGGVSWFFFDLPAMPTGSTLELDTEGSTLSPVNNTSMAMYRVSTGAVEDQDNDDGLGQTSALSYGPGGTTGSYTNAGVRFNGRDGTASGLGAPSRYYVAVVGGDNVTAAPATFQPDFVTQPPTANSGTAQLRVRYFTAGAPSETPTATTINLVDGGAWATATATRGVSDIAWFTFTTPAFDATGALDIDVVGTNLAPLNDTDMALYTSTGTLIDSDDVDGPGDLSQLSYGAGRRNSTGDAARFTGQDGTTAGTTGNVGPSTTYFLAVGPGTATTHATTFNTQPVTAANSGTITARVRAWATNAPTDPVAPPAAESLGNIVMNVTVTDTETLTLGSVKWYTFNLTGDVNVFNNRALQIDTEGSVTSPTANDTGLGLFTSTGTVRVSDTADGTGSLGALSFGIDNRPAPGDGVAYNGRDGALTAGLYYVAVTFGTPTFAADYSVTGVSTTVSGDITLNIRTFDPSVPSASPPVGTIDVGNIGTTTAGTEGLVSQTANFTDGNAVVWYKFTTSGDALASNSFYVDIDTEGTGPGVAIATGNINDTEIGLYTSLGGLVVSDDDDGSGQRSAISLGDNVNIRTAVPTAPDAAGTARNGRDGNLPAGTYYVSLSTFNTVHNTSEFSITLPTDRAATIGDRVINWRSNILRCTCCNLSNVAGANQSTTPDDVLTADDIIVFLGWFFANDARANVAGANQSTIPDNVLTADDIIVFLGRYFAGC